MKMKRLYQNLLHTARAAQWQRGILKKVWKRHDLLFSIWYFSNFELWTEVHNTVQEAANKTISKKKKSKKAKQLSGEALQIAEDKKWKVREKGKSISN